MSDSFATPWKTVARHAPLSTGCSRQEDWGGLPCPPPGDLPHPGTEPTSSALQADSLPLGYQGSQSPAVVSDSLWPHELYSMGFSRQEYRSGQPIPSPGDLPDPGIEPETPAWQVDSLSTEVSRKLEPPGNHPSPINVWRWWKMCSFPRHITVTPTQSTV